MFEMLLFSNDLSTFTKKYLDKVAKGKAFFRGGTGGYKGNETTGVLVCMLNSEEYLDWGDGLILK